MKRRVVAVDFFREQDDVLVLRTENDAVPFKRAKVHRRGEGRRGTVSRHRDISEIITSTNASDPRVFHAELFERGLGQKDMGRDLRHRPAIAAADHSQIGREGEPEQSGGLPSDDARIEVFQILVGNPVDEQVFIRIPARQGGQTGSTLLRSLGDADEEDHLPRLGADRAGVEYADDLEMVARGRNVLGPEQHAG